MTAAMVHRLLDEGLAHIREQRLVLTPRGIGTLHLLRTFAAEPRYYRARLR